ncbi:hypothetical protein [Arenibacter certesii]|uniref:Uncharacterized protein n=1 Tax=Arenibacter certesii TaxID=228955 RepID=A0A918IZF5_9FLAO|nr:hypothetical protein [Arenibacter certesii]GGW39386.1 hypothetical protein GCM10007383_25150 [Arenibacter certesii]
MAKSRKQTLLGSVSDEKSGHPLGGLTIEVIDKDLRKVARFKPATTDNNGRFKIIFESDEQEDTDSAYYLQILNRKGAVISIQEESFVNQSGSLEELDFKIPEAATKTATFHYTRHQFKSLVAINPNYFGAYEKMDSPDIGPAVYPQKGNTNYEELKCIGIFPEKDEVEAIFNVKLPYGFGGNLCTDGSKEYVAFYIDYGAGFQAVGPAVAVNTHNMAAARKRPLCYAVKQVVDFKKRNCQKPYLVRLRAILSWNTPPTGPNYNPTWGNAVEEWIQIEPLKKSWELITSDLTEISLQKSYSDLQFSKKELIESLQGSLDYNMDGLEKDRVGFKDNILKNPNYYGGLADKDNLHEAIEAINSLPQEILEKFKPMLVNPKWLIPVNPFNYNTTYEELTCVGLYPERDLLEATIAIKKQNGYKGNLCSVGSEEYVAFYVNWGDGAGYQHEGTTYFKAHDIPRDVNPLMYAVNLRIQDMEKKLKRCKEENVVRVRAILSWEVAPTGPSYKPAWGNVLHCTIQIRAIDGGSAKCEIQHINKILVEDINSQGYARKVINDTTLSPTIFNRPFGLIVAVWGSVNVPAAYYYRLRFSDDNGTNWNTVMNKRRYKVNNFTVGFSTPDSDGWFSKSIYLSELGNYSDTPLVEWHTGSRSGKHIVRLELANIFKNTIPGQVCEKTVFLDNQNVDHYSFINSTIPQVGVTVKDASGAIKKCDKYVGSDQVMVYGNFHDKHFNAFSLELFGGNLASSGVGITPAIHKYDQGGNLNNNGTIGAVDPGNGVVLTTVNMVAAGANIACAYGVRMVTSDRTIRGYFSTYVFKTTSHSRDAYVTFNWEP